MGLKIDYKEVKGPDEAYAKVKSYITPEYIQKFQVKADVSCDDAKKVVKATGSGFTLILNFHEIYLFFELMQLFCLDNFQI